MICWTVYLTFPSCLPPSFPSIHPSLLNKYCLSWTSCPQQPRSWGDGFCGLCARRKLWNFQLLGKTRRVAVTDRGSKWYVSQSCVHRKNWNLVCTDQKTCSREDGINLLCILDIGKDLEWSREDWWRASDGISRGFKLSMNPVCLGVECRLPGMMDYCLGVGSDECVYSHLSWVMEGTEL